MDISGAVKIFLIMSVIKPPGQTFSENGQHRCRCEITYIGHATTFLEMDGKFVLTDPMFSGKALVVPRVRPPSHRLEELPAPHLVLISHSHFDHLDLNTLKRIPVRATILVPPKVGELVREVFGGRVVELKKWETFSINGLTVTAVPARHHGMRFLTDFHRGYTGYVVQSNNCTVYFAGDSAYFKGFKKIGQRFSIDIALLPIGAYRPRLYMRLVHMDPREALQAFIDLRARWMIPIHWGTFRLSLERPDEPLQLLKRYMDRMGLKDRVKILHHGEKVCF